MMEVDPAIPKQKMYHITCFYFIGIQAGIQSYHAGMRFLRKYGLTPEFVRWLMEDEAVIVLAGGDTNEKYIPNLPDAHFAGGMQQALAVLEQMGIPCAPFYEPGVNGALSSISFLVPEVVWDRASYPDPEVSYAPPHVRGHEYVKELSHKIGEKYARLRHFMNGFQLAK